MPIINLTQGQSAIVDPEDFAKLNKFKWQFHQGYARRAIRVGINKQKWVLMHCEIMNSFEGEEIDHRDGNGLNNQRSNLRKSTHAQNLANQKMHSDNQSGYKGVTYIKLREQKGWGKPWMAQIVKNYKHKTIGYFETAKEAALAYDQEAISLFGEFARTNFVNGK